MNIAIVQIYDDNIKQYAEYSRLMNAMYAHQHKYTYICFEYDLVPVSVSVYYNKILALLSVLQDNRKFDYVLYLDSDALITNFKYKIEEIIQRHQGKDIIMASDANGTNNGVILLKNTSKSIEFLQKSYSDKNFYHTKTPEQTAMFHYARGEYLSSLGVEPAHFMNSYLDGYEGHNAPADQVKFWNKDSFILHLMSLSTTDRCTIFKQILSNEGIICISKPIEQPRAAQLSK